MIIGSKTIERYMASGNEHMARGNALMDRGNELMDRGNELMREIRDEMRFTREANRRNELVLGNLISITSDLRDESRAHSQAVLRMIDVLEERLPPPAAQ